MAANNPVQLRPDGLHLYTASPLAQLAGDETLAVFADGLLPAAIARLAPLPLAYTLGQALQQAEPAAGPLLAALLALDAAVITVLHDKPHIFPLPGFLAYRRRLPPLSGPGATLRLPPLNPNGHYRLIAVDNFFAAIRLDLHPRQKIAGHVRLAVAGPTRPAVRLVAAEHRLDRQILTPALVRVALAASQPDLNQPLTPAEQAHLAGALQALL
jgi:hypothetical protein